MCARPPNKIGEYAELGNVTRKSIRIGFLKLMGALNLITASLLIPKILNHISFVLQKTGRESKKELGLVLYKLMRTRSEMLRNVKSLVRFKKGRHSKKG